MRQRRRMPAGGVQAEKQRRYVRLIAQGVSNAEACRLVGINRRTGTRWRYGRSVQNSVGEVLHYPAVTITPEKPRSGRYLSEQERMLIADLLAAGNTCPSDRRGGWPLALDDQPGGLGAAAGEPRGTQRCRRNRGRWPARGARAAPRRPRAAPRHAPRPAGATAADASRHWAPAAPGTW